MKPGTVLILLGAAAMMPAQDTILPRQPATHAVEPKEYQWVPALRESITFLTIQQGFRIATQPDTRTMLKGRYFRDWLDSVGNLRGWDDGDTIAANYVGHPMEGAIAGYIYLQNDPRRKRLQFGDKGYWGSRARALAWSAIYSTNYELGPLGDGAIGNVGLQPGTKGAVDLVITPTFGIGWMVTEDIVDKYLVNWVERKWNNRPVKILFRSWLNPSRSMANVLRGRYPWHRDFREGIRDP